MTATTEAGAAQRHPNASPFRRFLLNNRAALGALGGVNLHVDRGDQIYLTEAPDGSYRISVYDPEFARQMELAEAIMREDREILRVLAK